MKTLADLARENGVTPQAVSNWRNSAKEKYGELPYQQTGRRQYYGDAEVAKILEFAPKHGLDNLPLNGSDSIDAVPAMIPEIVAESYRNKGQLAAMPKASDLSNLRGNVELTTFDDPLAAVDQAIQFADVLLNEIDADTGYQIQQAQQTQKANAKLRNKLEQLRLRQQQYGSDSRLIALIQNQQATELQQNMSEIQSLGKAPSPAEPSA